MPSKSRIIAAAIIVFARYGYRQTNMDAVATEAGLSRQALYNHFPNKEALFAAGVEHLHAETLNAAAQAAAKVMSRGGPLEETLLVALKARYIGLLERFAGSTHLEELTDAQTRECGQIVAGFSAKFRLLVTEIVERYVPAALLAEVGLKPGELAEDIITAARGIKYDHPPPSSRMFRIRLTRILRLILSAVGSPRHPLGS
jgi:AcrR family transcriptional regulator